MTAALPRRTKWSDELEAVRAGEMRAIHAVLLDVADDLDTNAVAVISVDSRVSDELQALRRALIVAALSFVVGFPTLAFSIVFAVNKFAGG